MTQIMLHLLSMDLCSWIWCCCWLEFILPLWVLCLLEWLNDICLTSVLGKTQRYLNNDLTCTQVMCKSWVIQAIKVSLPLVKYWMKWVWGIRCARITVPHKKTEVVWSEGRCLCLETVTCDGWPSPQMTEIHCLSSVGPRLATYMRSGFPVIAWEKLSDMCGEKLANEPQEDWEVGGERDRKRTQSHTKLTSQSPWWEREEMAEITHILPPPQGWERRKRERDREAETEWDTDRGILEATYF